MWVLVATTLITGMAWGAVVPPFEGPDESAFYKSLMNYAHGRAPGRLPLYALVMKPALKLAGGQDKPFQAKYNPSFRFISNRWGRVNMFMHGRAEGMPKGEVNRMYLLRLLTVLLWTVSLVLVFDTARLFFGRSDLALLTAGLCLSIPQLSFFASKIHPEATSTLLASIAYLAFTMRAYGRIGRVPMWVLGFIVLGLAPFSDRQAYFLILFVPFGLVMMETKKRNAAIAAAALLVPAVLLLRLPQFVEMQRDLQTWFAPFTPAYRAGWWNHDTPQYLLFEFAPKMFFGFCGWLGQPSILLPPPVYASMAAAMMLAAGGLCLWKDREPLTREQRRIARVFAAGVFVTIAPIVFTNILISRNSWHGRWLFPSIAPIMIGVVFGFRSWLATVRKRPYVVAAVLVGVAAGLGGLWVGAWGDAVRTGILGNHYGDQNHLTHTLRDTIVAVGVAGILAATGGCVSRRAAAGARPVPVLIFAGAWILNLLLLLTFVAPLYRPFNAEGFVAAVRGELSEGEPGHASALYRIGLAAYPESTALHQVGTEVPLLLLTGGDDQLIAELQARIGRGEKIENRQALMALARVVRTKGWLEPAALRQVLDQAEDAADLAEPRELIRAQLDGRTRDASAAADVIHAGNGVPLSINMHGDVALEGYTVHSLPIGGKEAVVYFRPLRNWSARRLWLHAYPEGSNDYIAIDPEPPVFGGWQVGELSWEVFHVPVNARYNSYLGVAIGENLGPGYPLGWIGR